MHTFNEIHPLLFKQMPCLMVNSNIKLDEGKAKLFVSDLSKAIANVLGKPESYCMIGYTHSVMTFGGTDQPCAFCTLQSIGCISAEQNKKTSAQVSSVTKNHLQIDSNRVYINFTDIKGCNWGFNGGTF